MAVDERRGRRDKAESPPEDFPETPPPQPTDRSWSLQMLMELQRTVGELSQSVETLKNESKEHDKKLNQINHRIYATVVVLTIFGAVLLWILNAVSDEIVTAVKEALVRSAD